jgi:hypothetical protein
MHFVQQTIAVDAVSETLANFAVKKCFDDIGQEIWPPAQQNPAVLAAQQKTEIERWWPVIKEANIKSQ